MATKRPQSEDEFRAKMAARTAETRAEALRAGYVSLSPPPKSREVSRFDNLPDRDEQIEIEAGRAAMQVLQKTFDTWITVGRAIQTIRRKAERMGGKQTFIRLMAENGFPVRGPQKVLDKGAVSKLETIMDRLNEVGPWHEGLPPKQRREWASPAAVFKHCPVFAKPKSNPAKQPAAQSPQAEKAKPAPSNPEDAVKHHIKALVALLRGKNPWAVEGVVVRLCRGLKDDNLPRDTVLRSAFEVLPQLSDDELKELEDRHGNLRG